MGIRRKAIAFCLAFLCHSTAWAEAPVPGAVEHQVKAADTLGTLSRLYGVSPEKLRALNGGKPPSKGQEFWVPPHSKWPKYDVKQGQTLAEIARGFRISELQLRQANGLDEGARANGSLLIPRAKRPEWKSPKKPLASRSGKVRIPATESSGRNTIRSPKAVPKIVEPPKPRPKAKGQWMKVSLADGTVGWVRSGALKYEEKSAPQVEISSLSFGKKLNQTQKAAIQQMVVDLGERGYLVKADDIINFMALETGGTFSPSATSPWNGAVGLAQFTDIAIRDLNRSRAAGDKLSKSRLAKMSFQEQSTVVTDYLSTAFKRKKMQGKEIHASDLYSAIFCPKAIGLPLASTVYSSGRDPGAYSRNRSLDQNSDGRITKAEMVVRLNKWAERGEVQRG